MAVTRINNNQISDAVAGNAFFGINAAVKLQNYSITSQKIANNLTYGSDLTIAGNLTVQGNTTAIDTTYTTVEDPVILLASGQTGSPTVDIGFVGQRGIAQNIAFVWDESASEFITAFTTTGETNTTVSIASYTSFHTGNANIGGNIVVNGTSSFVGNVLGNVTFTGNVVIPSLSTTGNITGGNLLTGGIVSAAGNITSAANVTGGNLLATTTVSAASHIGSVVSVSGNVTGGNINTAGLVTAIGNVIGGNLISAAAIRGATGFFTGNVDVLGNLNASIGVVYANSGIFYGNAVTGNNAAYFGVPGYTFLGSDIVIQTTGNVNNYSQINFQNINNGTRSSTDFVLTADNGNDSVHFFNMGITGSTWDGTQPNSLGNALRPNDGYLYADSGNVIIGTVVPNDHVRVVVGGSDNNFVVAEFHDPNTLSTSVTTGTLTIAGGIGANGNVWSTNMFTTGQASAAGNVTGGNIRTAGQVSATGNVTAGNVIAAGLVQGATLSSTGNITAAANIAGGNLLATTTVSAASHIGSVVSVTANVTGGNILTGGLISATGNVTSAANIAGGNLLATTTVSAASHIGSVVSVTANVTAGNVLTGGLVSATGNVTSAANVSGGNLVATSAVVTPTVIGTTVTISSTGGLITLAPSSNVSTNSKNINNLADPVQNQDAATKAYVDNMVSTQIAYHQAVVAATTTTLETATGGTITYAQPNGAGNGVGATLTVAGGTFNLIDTANIQTANTRVLVKNQANGALNGIYRWSNATVLVRTSDADEYGPNSSEQLSINDYFFVQSGNVNAGSAWIVDSPSGTITFGTSNVQFAQFSSSQTYTANTLAGISITGTVISAKVDNNTTAFDGSGNIIVKAGANLTTPNIGAATGTSLSVTGNLTGAGANISGNVSGGNILTGGLVSTTGNITSAANVAGGNLLATTTVSAASHVGSVVSVTANVTGGNLLTGGLISSTGNVTSAANIAGGNVVVTSAVTAATVSASANITGGNLITSGVVSATGNISTAGNITAAYYFGNGSQLTGINATTSGFPITAGTSNIAAATNGNIGVTVAGTSNVVTFASTGQFTTGLISATGNILSSANVSGGNLLATTTVSAASHIGSIVSVTANVTGGNLLTGGLISSTGNVTSAANIAGGNLLATTTVSAASHIGSVVSVTANITGGNLLTGGLISSTGNITSAANVSGGNVLATTLVSAPSFTGTLVSMSGNITGANVNTGGANGLTLNASNINSNAGRITINSSDSDVDFAVDGLSSGNVFYVDAGTKTVSFGSSTQTTNAIVAMNATNSFLMPVGTTMQRPGTGVTGMLRFNSSLNAVEIYDNSTWATVGTPSFTVISDQQFNGDGVTVAFTLSTAATTNSVIVSINGVIQIPTLAYSVSTTTLTFTEAPQSGDVIDVRTIVTTTSVTSISNSPGNAVIGTNATQAIVEVTGNLNPTANVTYSLGNTTARWKDLWLAGTSLYMGNIIMKNTTGNTVAFYAADGTTPATIDSTNVDTTTITNGTSNVSVATSGGNVRVNIGGTSNVAVFATTGAFVTGLVSATGNVSGGNLNVTGNIVDTGALSIITGSNGNIALAPNGTGVVVFNADIRNGQANGVGNIGTSTGYFNTAFVKATSAQYADLAENYVADAVYEPGTVVSFGGAHEITLSTVRNDRRIAGVVSTNPSYIMNAVLEGEHVAIVALTGRVPTKVSGPVAKGDMMVSDGNGRAIACASPSIGTVIGKALQDNISGDGIIEVVVGRL